MSTHTGTAPPRAEWQASRPTSPQGFGPAGLLGRRPVTEPEAGLCALLENALVSATAMGF